MAEEGVSNEILVLPFFGQGHINPCVQLCKHLSSSHNCKSILIIPSHLSSSIPSNLHHPLLELLQIPASYSPSPIHGHHHHQLGQGIENFLSQRYKDVSTRPGCVIMDVMMSWSKYIFKREGIPIVSFFTSGACSTAMEHAAWQAHAEDIGPGEIRMLPGLPESMALRYSDLKRRGHRPGGGRGGRQPPRGMDFGPPRPGQPPRWMEEADDSAALLINTCDELEGKFLTYLADQVGKPVLGVGPLLPESYWKPSSTDRGSKPLNRESNYTEDEVIQWLDSKPAWSVIYVSFGSEVGPTMEEYGQLAEALGESDVSFIWVIQPGSGKPGPPPNFGGSNSNTREGFYPKGLEEEVRDRGLIIKGWAPQLMILSHPSTGGFLSHCGWNSTVEAIGQGVPILAWPIRGDQYYNAKLVVEDLRAGYMVSTGDEMVKREDVKGAIEKMMEDKEIHDRAMGLKGVFGGGYPVSSGASLKALMELIGK